METDFAENNFQRKIVSTSKMSFRYMQGF